MLFKEFCLNLEKIALTRSRLEITAQISELFSKADQSQAMQIAYLLQGEIAPAHKTVRFNFAEKQMSSTLKQLCEAKGFAGIEFDDLKTEMGDLGLVVQYIFEKLAPRKEAELSISNVFEFLESFAEISGDGSVDEKKLKLSLFLEKTSAIEAKYLIKIILGSFRMGFSTQTILDGLAKLFGTDPLNAKILKKNIEAEFNVCADAGLIAKRLKQEGALFLNEPNPVLGIPIIPAAAERVDVLEDLFKKQTDFILEPKLDGLRIQIHKSNNKVIFFSRNLNDVTHMFPEMIGEFLNLKQDNFILDGEVVGFDESELKNLAFQKTTQRRRKHEVSETSSEIPIKIHLFDIMMHENEPLLSKPFYERREFLEKFGNQSKKIDVIAQTKVDLANQAEAIVEIKNQFEHLFELGYEGLMAKKTDGVYQAGKRNFNWIKIKQITESRLGDSIDAVIIGMYLGKGKRAHFGVGSFLLGVKEPRSDSYQTLARAGSGLQDEEFKRLAQELKPFQTTQKPTNYMVHNSLTPDIWILPEKVVEVIADEITVSKVHSSATELLGDGKGLALRFPRIVKIRQDKSFEEITTTDELLTLAKIHV